MTVEDLPSEYGERDSTLSGRLSLAAARLALKTLHILNAAKRRSGLSNKEIAEKLGLSAGRVSQVLNGDGNLHVATIARFLGACDYELTFVARPLKEGLATLSSETRRERKSPQEPRKWETNTHLYLTHYVSPSGITPHISVLSTDTTEPPIPLDSPQYLGFGHAFRTARSLHFEPDVEPARWIKRTQMAIEGEDPQAVMHGVT